MQGPLPSVAPPRVHKMAFLTGDSVEVTVEVDSRWKVFLLGGRLSRDGRRHEVASMLDRNAHKVRVIIRIAVMVSFMLSVFVIDMRSCAPDY